MPNRLQCLDVPIVSDEDCERAYPGMITRRMLCAGYMEGGRDACNVRMVANEGRHQYTPANTPSIVFDRETPAAPWCVSEKSMAWCRGVRGVPFPTTPESTSKCVNSFTGSTTSCAPTLKENHPIVSFFNPDSTFLFFFGIFFKFPPPKNTCVAKMQENPIKPLGISLFSFLLSLCLPF